MHLVWVPTRQEVKAAERWVARVNERAGDRFKINTFPGGSLGVKDPDMLRILPMGNVVQVTMLYAGYVARDAPDLGYALPEGIMSKPDDVVKLMPELHKVFEQGYSKWGIKYLANFLSPDRTLNIYCKTPVNTLEELRKKKLRVWSKTLVDTFSKLGVSASIIPQNDMYVAMQTGVVDCATYYPGAANTISLHEVAPHWAYIAPYAVPIELIVSKKAFDALPADIQKILEEEAKKMEQELTAAFLEGSYETAEAKKFEAAGGKKQPDFPKADQEALNKAAKDVWVESSKQLGGKVWENYQNVSAALNK